jgi:hypothetical protein
MLAVGSRELCWSNPKHSARLSVGFLAPSVAPVISISRSMAVSIAPIWARFMLHLPCLHHGSG